MKRIFSSRLFRIPLILLVAIGFVVGIQAGTFANLGQRILGSNRVELDSGLVHHVKYDDPKLLDSETESVCTTSTNDPAVYVNDRRGFANRAVEFNGIDGSDTYGTRCPFSKPTNVSVSVWVNLDNWRNSNNDASHIVYPGSDGWAMTSTGAHWNTWIQTGGGEGGRQNIATTVNRTLGEWHHLSMTYDQASGVHNLYVDGQLQATQTLTPGTAIVYGGNDFFDVSHNHYNLDGKVDDVRIYNRAINANEVKALYDSYKPEIVVSDLQKGLIGHFKFDGDAKDSTPYDNPGNPKNGIIAGTDRHGQSGKADDLDGVDDEIEFNPFPVVQRFSFAIWVKVDVIDTGPNSAAIILRSFPSGNGAHAIILRDDGTIGCSVPRVSSSYTTSAAISTGQWYHLVCTYDQNTIRSYINGSLANAVTIGSGTVEWTSLQVTDDNAGTRDIFDGKVDDLRIYNRAITVTEVKQLYDQYDPVVQISDLQKGLLFHAKLDENNAKDSTPHSIATDLYQNITTATDRHGKANSALTFDNDDSVGNASRIRYPDSQLGHISALAGTSNITIAGWVKPDDLSSFAGVGVVLSRNGPFLLRVSTEGGVSSHISASGGQTTFTSGNGCISNGAWQHVAVTYDGTNRIHYCGGVQVGSVDTSASGTLNFSSTYMTIGYDHCCGNRAFFNGSLDEIRLYNRTLSPQEIKALYETY